MARSPYSSYHGRKRVGRSILIGIVTALVILLAAVLTGYYLGLFNIPGAPDPQPTAGSQVTPNAQPTAPATPSQEPAVIIEPATPSPSPSPAVSDLSDRAIRDISLGLVLTAPDALPETSRHGALVDVTGLDLAALGDDFSAKLAALPYAAAWVAPDWAALKTDASKFNAELQERCAALAALGFDELVLSAADLSQVEKAALAESYAAVYNALAKAGWQGRLGLDLDQNALSGEDADALVAVIAADFDRLYFRKTLTSPNKKALTGGGFEANGKTLVTVVKNPADLGYAWAILP